MFTWQKFKAAFLGAYNVSERFFCILMQIDMSKTEILRTITLPMRHAPLLTFSFRTK